MRSSPTPATTPLRTSLRFPSGDTTCAAWHYRGSNGACVIMAGGFAVTKEPGTDAFARAFHAAGYSVLAFDYRHLGGSGGEPRLVLRMREHRDDWDAAIGYAATLPGVEAHKLAVWGFSVSGGIVIAVAARHPELAAVVAQTPNVDGPASARNAARHQKLGALLRFSDRAVLDALGRRVGRPPKLVPLVGAPGTVALLTTPDARDGERALNPDNRYPDWEQQVSAWSALRVGFYRPGRHAKRVRCPLLVVVCDGDQSALAPPAVRAAGRAPTAELVRFPGGHYAPFLEVHDDVVGAELAFLNRHVLGAEDGLTADFADAQEVRA